MYIHQTHSTNSLLKEACSHPDEWADLLAEPLPHIRTDYQTAGRGQMGNTWESKSGENILLSVLLVKPDISIDEQFLLSEIFPIAVIEGVEDIVGIIGLKVKWPNDIYYDNSKLAGILIENTLSDGHIENAILGIGLNVNQFEWLGDAPNPISLRQITGKMWNIQTLTKAILDRLTKRLANIDRQEIKQAYMRRLFRRDEYAYFTDITGTFEGKIFDIDAYGRLKVEDRQGRIKIYNFKEIKYIL